MDEPSEGTRTDTNEEPLRILEGEVGVQEAPYRDLFDDGPIAYLLVGRDGRIQRSNRAAEKLVEAKPGGLVGTAIQDLYVDGAAGKEKAHRLWEVTLRGVALVGDELRVRTRTGQTRWVRAYTKPILDGAGELTVVRSVFVDITLERMLMAEKEKAIADLQDALRRVTALEGLVGVCGWCGKVRGDDDEWLPLETYVSRKTSGRVTHGMCPSCAMKAEG